MAPRKPTKKSPAKRRASAPKSAPKSAHKSAEKSYQHGVPDARLILDVLEKKGVPTSLKDLTNAAGIKDDKGHQALNKRLKKMLATGQLLQNRRNEFCLPAKLGVLVGKVSGHPDGFGFFIPEDGSDDMFLPYHEMRALLDGDKIAVRLSGMDNKGRRKCVVVEILERGKQTVVGTFKREHGIAFVVESASRTPHQYMVAEADYGGAHHGQLVKLEILEYPTARREAQGKVIAILGSPEDPGMLTTLAIESFGLRTEWPSKVSEATAKWGAEVREADKQDRVDLRETPLVTIDGADARDFDDAVYAEPSGKGWKLLVAIADVAHYVQSDDALDQEARKRGTSTYFPDQVVPMLPEALSNGLCSLNPHVDRLCLVCEMQISEDGKVDRSKFYKGVMRSHARLTYAQVNAAVGLQDKGVREELSAVLPHLEHLYKVYKLFERARSRRGALDLDLPEVRITLGSDDSIETIAPVQRNDAHKLIEECMIAANVEAAKFLRKNKLPNLYRIHPEPEMDRFEELRVMLQELGFKVAAEARTQPRELNKILAALHERPDFPVLATSVLRTLSQALYQPQNEGHYGLALDAYTHFTSPIRRYPDLLVHRGIAHLVAGGKPAAFEYKLDKMEQLGKNCSMLERQAEAASRHVETRYKVAYMQQHLGEEFDGVITSVKHFGLFIMLNDLFVEGLVHVTNLGNDYYHAEHGGLRLTGEQTGNSYGLGDQVRVKLTRVDVEAARIDLQMVEDVLPDSGKGEAKEKGNGRSNQQVGKKKTKSKRRRRR